MSFKPSKVAILREAVVRVTQILTNKSIRVVQEGMKAAVKYNSITHLPEVVYLPMIPDDASDELMEAVQGFLDHEVGHVLHSNGAVLNAANKKLGKTGASMLNMVEDVYIERKQTELWRGTATNLSNTGRFYLSKFVEPRLAEARAKGDQKAEISVMMPCVIRALGGQFVFKEFLAKSESEPAKMLFGMLEDLSERIQHLNSSADSVAVTEEILARLKSEGGAGGEGEESDEPSEGEEKGEKSKSDKGKKKDNKKGEKEKAEDKEKSEGQESDEGEDSEGGDQDDEGDESESEGDQDGEEQEGKEGDQEGKGGEPEEGEGEDTDAEDDGEGGENEGEGDDTGEGSDSGDEEGEDGEGTEGESESEGEPSEGASSDGEETAHNASEGGHESGTGRGPKDRGEGDCTWADIAAAVADSKDFDDATADVLSGMALAAASESDYFVYTTEKDVIEKLPVSAARRDGFLNHCLKHIDEPVSAMVGPMQKELERAVAARSAAIYTGGFRSGRLHSSSLHRIKAGDDRVFRRKQESNTKDVAVQLVIDASGSMGGAKILLATQSAYALSSVLDRMRIKHEVIAFTTGGDTIPDWDTYSEARSRGIYFARTEAVYMPILKSFDEAFNSDVRARYGALPTEVRLANNIDGESIEYAARRLAQQKAARHVMIVLSDGNPAARTTCPDGSVLYKDLKRRIKKIESAKIDVVGIGIMSSAVKDYYRKHVVLNDVATLPTTVIRELRHLLIPE